MERKLRGRESVGGWELIGIGVRTDRYCDLGFQSSDVVAMAWIERPWTKRHPTVWEDKSRGSNGFEREKTCLKKNYLFLGQITNTTKFIVFGKISTKFYLYFFFELFQFKSKFFSFLYFRETRIISIFKLFVFVFDKLIFFVLFFY